MADPVVKEEPVAGAGLRRDRTAGRDRMRLRDLTAPRGGTEGAGLKDPR